MNLKDPPIICCFLVCIESKSTWNPLSLYQLHVMHLQYLFMFATPQKMEQLWSLGCFDLYFLPAFCLLRLQCPRAIKLQHGGHFELPQCVFRPIELPLKHHSQSWLYVAERPMSSCTSCQLPLHC